MNKEYISDFKIKDLIPYERNPRRNDSAVDSLIKEIKAVGNNDPIEVNEDNIILCGHTRLKALKKLGYETTDIIRISGLTEDQQKRYRVTNNKTGELAEWDFELLESEFDSDELTDMSFDFNEKKSKLETINTDGYKKIHVLLSFTPDDYLEISDILNKIKDNEKIEYEQTAN